MLAKQGKHWIVRSARLGNFSVLIFDELNYAPFFTARQGYEPSVARLAEIPPVDRDTNLKVGQILVYFKHSRCIAFIEHVHPSQLVLRSQRAKPLIVPFQRLGESLGHLRPSYRTSSD
jgi:hypothetical protein